MPCYEAGEEIRDAVLWLTVLDIARSSDSNTIAFISNKDFSFLRGMLVTGLIVVILAGVLNMLIIGSSALICAQGVQSAPDSKAALLNVWSEKDGIDLSTPITPESADENDKAFLATLELRSGRQTCRGVADLSQLAHKCQTSGSAPLIRQ